MTGDTTGTDADDRPATVPGPVGHDDTCLIVLRGNSGSGKSTIARTVRDRYGRGLALVEQDYLRRIVLRERDTPDGNAAALIAHTITFALDIGYHVLCEGILHRSRYGPMLDELRRAHRGTTAAFYLDISLDETLRRHTQRPQATQFSEQDMRGWYLERDVLGFPGEQVIGARSTLDDTTNLIFSRLPDTQGRVLLVKPASEPGWRLPGGVIAPGESPHTAATRIAADGLGLAITPGEVLAIDHVPTTSHRTTQLVLVIDGGTIAPDTALAASAREPATYAFIHSADLVEHLPARHARRAAAAVTARHRRSSVYLEDGRPITPMHRSDHGR